MNQTGRGAGNGSPETEAEQSDENRTAMRREVTFSEAGGVTVAAIVHLLRLVSAELVLLRGLDITHFETVARKKLDEFTSPTANRQARDMGLAFAHDLLEQVLVQIRAQAEVKKRLGPSEPQAQQAAPAAHAKFLN
jgi:hypothetical protein